MSFKLADCLEFELVAYKNAVSIEISYDTFDYYAGPSVEHKYVDLDKEDLKKLVKYLQNCIKRVDKGE